MKELLTRAINEFESSGMIAWDTWNEIFEMDDGKIRTILADENAFLEKAREFVKSLS